MSGITTFANICPADCSTAYSFPALDTDQNCVPQLYQSEITDLWIKPDAAAATEVPYDTTTGWGSATDFAIAVNATSIDNTVTDNSKVKWLTFVGDLPAADKSTIIVQKFAEATLRRTYTLTGTVYNLADDQYDFLKGLQCNPLSFTFWYGNTNHIFGKDTGIEPTFVDVDFVYASGEDSVEHAIVTLRWKAQTDPERRNNPYS